MDPIMLSALLKGGQSIGNILGGVLNYSTYKNPAESAMPYLNQMGGQSGQYLNPYITAGQGAMGQLQGQYGNLISNPGQMFNQFGQSFQQSPGYQWQLGQGLQAANQAAAAGGMLGTPAHQQQSQQVAQGLANQDYYNYMNPVMNMYGQGLQGLQGINQMGYGASNQMANTLMEQLMAQAQTAAYGTQGQNQNIGGSIGSILSGIFGGGK